VSGELDTFSSLLYKSVCVLISCKESSAVSRVSGPLKAGFPKDPGS
jgi:hypothetical protein